MAVRSQERAVSVIHDPLCSGCNYCRPLEPCEVEECPNAAEYRTQFCREHALETRTVEPIGVAADCEKGAIEAADTEGLPASMVARQHGEPSEHDIC
jgi:Fe-S-cluster-containing dehydrogenase component